MKVYDSIRALNGKYNAFDLGHNHFLTMDFGKITPVGWFEAIPGDIFDLDFEALVRVQPMLAPLMNNIVCELFAFFCPSRLLYPDFEKFITTVDMSTIPPQSFEGSLPVWAESDKDKSLVDIDTSSGELWDCFGLSRIFKKDADREVRPNDMLRRAYYFIYNEWFRDENLQEPIDFFNDNSKQQLMYRSWRKDYFTSAFYDRQKGQSPSLPLTGVGSVTFNNNFTKGILQLESNVSGSNFSQVGIGSNDSGTFDPKGGYIFGNFPSGDNINVKASNPVGLSAGGNYTLGVLRGVESNNSEFEKWLSDNNTIDFSQVATSFNVADMRDMFAIQGFLEDLMRGGSRYIEFLQFFYGVSPKDARLQIPERIGSVSFNIQISEVLQTGETTSTSPQGNMSGHGLSVTGNSLGNYMAEEFGYIVIVACIQPPAVYVDRIPRELSRKSLLDQVNPHFYNLSYQAIHLAELYATGLNDNVTGDLKIFGYQGRFDECREKLSYVTGDFYDKLSYYLNFRKFETPPALNDDFLQCKPNKDIFAVTDEPPFLCNFYWNVKAMRKIPFVSEPGLVDHVYGGV